jgi:hypothetical protein
MQAADPILPPPAPFPTLTDLRLGWRGSVLRPAPGWALVAGLLLSPHARPDDPLRAFTGVLLAFILVDPVWGALWHHLVSAARDLAVSTRAITPPLPYAHEQAPLARLWAWWQSDRAFGGRATGLILLPLLALSLVLGRPALIASVIVLLAGLLAAAIGPAFPGGVRPLAALTALLMPWYVGLMLWAPAAASLWPLVRTGTTPTGALLLTWGLPVLFAWFALLDGDPATTASPGGRWRLVGGHLLLIGCLALAGKPHLAGLTALVLLEPTLALRRPHTNPAPWHLFALLLLAVLG